MMIAAFFYDYAVFAKRFSIVMIMISLMITMIMMTWVVKMIIMIVMKVMI